jgi:hypothetical protein
MSSARPVICWLCSATPKVVRASKAHLVALDQNSTIIAVIAVSRARSWSREGEPAGVV